MTRILVTGAGGAAGSNFIHSLRLAKPRTMSGAYHIVGSDKSAFHLELADVDARYLLPDVNEPDYLEKLNKLIEREKIDIVHPQPDVEVEEISLFRGQLAARTFLPNHETIMRCMDKTEITRLSAFTPPSAQAKSEQSVGEITDAILRDSNQAWIRAIRGAGSRASLPVDTADQAMAWARYWVEIRGLFYEDFMISAFLPGREFAFQSLWNNGRLITSAVRERVEYLFGNLTPSGQSSSPSVARSVHNPTVNMNATTAIFAVDRNATGVFCVDLKENEAGLPLVTEVNAGRFFTTSNFFATAGANMPETYISLALGEAIEELPMYDAVPAGLYWVRQMDMGFKLVREGEWTAKGI